MATVREIRAMFTAEAKGIQKAFKQIRQEASKLSADSKKTTSEVNKHYDSLSDSTDKLKRALEDTNNVEAFSELTEASEKAQKELRETGHVSAEAMDEMENAIQDAARRFNSLGPEARASFNDVGRAIESVNGELSNLRSTAGGSLDSLSGAASGARGDLGRVGDAANDLDADLRDLGSDNGFQDVEEDANSLGDTLGSLGGAGGIIAGVGGAFVAASAGVLGFVAAGAGILSVIKGGDDLQRTLNGLQTATGAADEEMADMKDTLKNIYGNNYGESFDDIAESMVTVRQMTGAADEELEGMTTTALMLRDTFQYEVAESTKAAQTLMKNFGLTGQESYALIAEGTQKGLNYADDLLDTIGEYSVYYEQAGFSAQEMFGMFKNAQETGAFNLDYAADAFKEFGIIMTEDSDRAAEALDRIGLPAGQLIEDFSNGGESARQAFETIAQKLGGVEDPLTQTQVGIELFGTKFEDLGATAVIEMSKTNDSVQGTADVLENIDKIKYNSIGEAIAGMGRSFTTEVLIPIQDRIMPALNDGMEKVKEFSETFKRFGGGLKGLFQDDGQEGRDILKSLGFSEEMVMMLDGYAARIAEFRDKVSDFVEGIKGLFYDDGQAGRDFLASLGFSDELIMKIDAWAQNISAFRGNLKETIDGIRGLFKDDGEKGRNILSSLGFTDNFVQTADNIALKIVAIRESLSNAAASMAEAWEKHGSRIFKKIQEVLIDLWPSVKSAVSGVASFIGDTVGKIAQFWEENGSQIIAAVSNAFNFILSIIQFVMPLVLAIIKSIWGNIKGVITGALDIIMGVVKVFSGLFTGDFKKMWEGLKQIFFGAVNFLWNFIQLTFYGKILGGAKAFILSFRSFFDDLWKGIVALFKGQTNSAMITIRTAWATILRETKSVFTSVWHFFRDIFLFIKNVIVGAVTGYIRILTTSWSAIFNTTKNIFTNVWNFFKSIFTTIRNFISGSVSGIFTKVKDTWSMLKTNTTGAFRDIFNAIKTKFTDIVNLAKNLPKRIGDGIGSMASKVNSGVTKVINKLASTLGKGVNGVIGGINWVLGKIGVDSKIPEWDVPQYARGTGKGGHPGGLALVNDGKGDNAGPELIKTPDGKMGTLPGKNVITNLPAGTEVLSAKNTREYLKSLPAYAWGTDVWNGVKNLGSKAWEGTKKIGSKIKDVAVDVFDYIKSPGKFLNLALKTLGIDRPSGTGFVTDMAKGAFDKVKDAAVGKVKSALDSFGAEAGGGPANFGSAFRKTSSYGWRTHPITGKRTFHNGDDYGAPVGTPIPSQGAGQVVYAGYHGLRGNYVKIRSGNIDRIYQHNQRNLVGTGDYVRMGQSVGTVGSTGASTGPHLHYEVLRNGEAIRPNSLKGVTLGKAGAGGMGGAEVSAGAKYLAAIVGDGDWMNDWATHLPKNMVGKALGYGKKAADYIRRYGSPANLYFDAIADDGDWMNDWATHLPKSIRNSLLSVGKGLAQLQGYAGGGIIDKKQLAWIAEGGWAESIISHDPAKRTSQRAIWEKTGEELGFGAVGSESNRQIVELLARIADATESGHGHDIVVDDRVLGELVEPHVTERQKINKAIGNKFKG